MKILNCTYAYVAPPKNLHRARKLQVQNPNQCDKSEAGNEQKVDPCLKFCCMVIKNQYK